MIFRNFLALSVLVLLVGCATTPNKYPTVNYLSKKLPEGVINTTPNSATTTKESSRVSVGVYRPPVKFDDLLDADKIYRDVDVVLQTPMCAFPVICTGVDKVISVSENEKL